MSGLQELQSCLITGIVFIQAKKVAERMVGKRHLVVGEVAHQPGIILHFRELGGVIIAE